MDKVEQLVEEISKLDDVISIGISGSLKPYPMPGKGDFDIFIYCDEIPSEENRLGIIKDKDHSTLKIFENDVWGTADYLRIDCIDAWLMYFKMDQVKDNLKEILSGEYLGRIDNYYYPIGRLAMFKNMTILYDKGSLQSLIEDVKAFPITLKEKLIKHNMACLMDYEDLDRAVYKKDVMFYHFALDLALDCYLLVLFSLNDTYFPSRKRSFKFISSFEIKPVSIEKRLKDVILKGASEDTLESSLSVLKNLCDELNDLI